MKASGIFAAVLVCTMMGLSLTGCGGGTDTDNNGGKSNGGTGGNNTTKTGAAVSAPTLNSKNSNSITINPASFIAGNPGSQTIEYGRNASNIAPANWQDGVTFSGLNANTTYYIFARSKANTTHNAGLPSAGLPVTTDPEFDPNRVSTPITDKPAGSVPHGTEIRLGTTTVGATIYYTTDGNDPTVFSPVYSDSSPIKINAPTTIKALATATGMTVSTVMTAAYTPTYTVTFNSDGGTSVASIRNVDHGSTITAPIPPTRIDYQFVGWYKNSGLTSAWDFATDTVTANTTLYARWILTVVYTVTYSANGATSGTAPVAQTQTASGSSILLASGNGLARTGYIFGGWNTNSAGTGYNYNAGASYTPTSNITLYAKWNATYTVTFNKNNTDMGSAEANPSTKTVTSPATNVGTLPTAPTRTGYLFSGWNTQSNGDGTAFTATTTVINTITVYAQWVRLPEMVQITGGTFTMGSDDLLDNYVGIAANPPHQVTLTGFRMSKYEITQAQYQVVTGTNPSYYNGASSLREPASGEIQGNRPVEQVTWYDAVEFCNKLSEIEGLTKYYTISGRSPTTGYPITSATVTVNSSANGYRLPTEAQWEYAAKGGSGSPGSYIYSGSNIVDNVAWYWHGIPDDFLGTHEVGKKAPNGLGLYDMSGNVEEWCWDRAGAYTSEAQTDPNGPTNSSWVVRRGGHWGSNVEALRSAYRSYSTNMGSINEKCGFRIVRP